MAKLKVGIFGCGGIMKWSHLPAYAHIADQVEIVALCDIVPGRCEEAKELAARMGDPMIIMTEKGDSVTWNSL